MQKMYMSHHFWWMNILYTELRTKFNACILKRVISPSTSPIIMDTWVHFSRPSFHPKLTHTRVLTTALCSVMVLLCLLGFLCWITCRYWWFYLYLQKNCFWYLHRGRRVYQRLLSSHTHGNTTIFCSNDGGICY